MSFLESVCRNVQPIIMGFTLSQTEPLSTWLDIKSGIFGPSDQRLPLPGNVGLVQQMMPNKQNPVTTISTVTSKPQTSSILINQINEDQQLQVIYIIFSRVGLYLNFIWS